MRVAFEDEFHAAARDFGDGDFVLGGEAFGTLVKLVRELELDAFHGAKPTRRRLDEKCQLQSI